jgi:hypothetical protein
MVCRTALVRRRRAGEGARRGAKPKIARAGHKGIPWIAVGSVLGTGSAAGAALFIFVGIASDAGVTAAGLKLHNPVAEGCTALTIDRDKRQTEAAPCPDTAAEVAASWTLPFTPAAY